MKIVFIARHYSYLRLFESAIVEMAQRGHEVLLAADREEVMGGRGMVERIAERFPNVRTADAPGRSVGAWAELASRLRLGLDYLRFLDGMYDVTPHLRRRARERAPAPIVFLAESPLGWLLGGRRGLAAVLRALERGIPVHRALEEFLRQEAPDILLVTPLVGIGSPQMDHIAAARALGIKTVLPVGSWDHLSSKSLLRTVPERVLVWNEVQRREAVELHRVPADRVVVTGAQCFDQWFDRSPALTREAFCERVGLRPDRPYILYVCSSLFRGTASEPVFVDEWIRAVRSSDDPRLKDVSILIRPHPARLAEWKNVDWSSYRDVSFWGAHPIDKGSKEDYFDSMYYSAAVVGLNTSAFIEAAVVGKPVHAILRPEISKDNQEGTLHFHYLLTVNGGLLRTARTLDEHVSVLAGSLAGPGGGDEKARRFVEGFVRPHGLDRPATPAFADAIDRAGTLPRPAPRGRGLSGWLGYLAMYPVAAAIALHIRTQPSRKRTRHKLRKQYDLKRTALLRRIKQFASDRLREAGIHREKAPKPGAGASMLTPKAGRQRDPSKELAGNDLREARQTRELITVLGRSDRPVIIGPWLSETGFELLYWIPFIAWAKAYGNFDPERLIVVSRGGTAGWYRHITPHYEDVFSMFSPDEFRLGNERRIEEQGGRMKHVDVSSFDREIVARVEAKRGLKGAELIHPSLMYQLFDHFWFQRAPVTLVEAFTAFSPIAAGADTGIRTRLPQRYVAAKFYGNTALPSTPANDAFVASYLAELSEQVDVVLLNTTDRYDDHLDYAASARGRLHRIDALMTPENNLAVQTEVIRHAQAFVGTYGGFSYLAPLCGVNTLALYSHAHGFRFDHLEVAKRVFASLQCGTFTEVDLRAADMLRLSFGTVPRAEASTALRVDGEAARRAPAGTTP